MRAEWGSTHYLPQFIALVVVPDERDGWTKPQLHGWRIWHENPGAWNERVAYEPVTLRFWGNEPERCPKPTPEVWDDAARRRHLLDMGIGAVDRTGRPMAVLTSTTTATAPVASARAAHDGPQRKRDSTP